MRSEIARYLRHLSRFSRASDDQLDRLATSTETARLTKKWNFDAEFVSGAGCVCCPSSRNAERRVICDIVEVAGKSAIAAKVILKERRLSHKLSELAGE